MPLSDIQTLLNANDLDTITALSRHRELLLSRQSELGTMLATVDKTLAKLRGETDMSDQELYEGFPTEAKQYREEAFQKYGKQAMEKSEAALKRLSAKQQQELQAEFVEVWETLASLVVEEVTSREVQTLIAKHYQLTRQFWGSAHDQDKQLQAYEGLGTLYIEDERFTAHKGQPRPALAKFMRDAIKHFCSKLGSLT